MMSVSDIFILLYGYIFSGVLVYLIDNGMHKKHQLVGVIIAVVICLCYALFAFKNEFSNLNYGFLTLPVVAVVVFNFAAILSWRLHNREFKATWRGARYYHSKEKKLSDYLLSFIIIIIELCWPIFVALCLRGENAASLLNI